MRNPKNGLGISQPNQKGLGTSEPNLFAKNYSIFSEIGFAQIFPNHFWGFGRRAQNRFGTTPFFFTE
jgi:hypothetical protein